MRPSYGLSLATFLVLGCCVGCTTIDYPASDLPALKISPASISFTLGTGTPPLTPQTVTLTNSGRETVSIASIALTGPGASVYALTDACGSVLAVGASCTFSVSPGAGDYTPYSAAVLITDNVAGSPQVVPINTNAYPTPVTARAQYGFVSNNGGTVDSYTISATGAWTLTSPGSVDIGDYLGSMVLDPLGKFLVVAGFVNGSLNVFTITPGTGVLAPAFVYPNASVRSESMAIDPMGRFLYVNNGGNDTLSIFSIDRATGALTPGSPAVIPTGDSYGVNVDPTGKFLYINNVADPSTPDIAMYSIDQSSGAVTPLAPATVPALPGFTLVFDPTGKFMYNFSSRATGVKEFDVNQTTGLLTAVNPDGPVTTTGLGPTDAVVTPNGKFAYVTDRDGNQVSEYSVDPGTGALTQLPGSPIALASEPFAIAMDPSGNLVDIICEGFGVAILSVGADGQLTQVNSVPTTDFTVGIAIYPTVP